jgi:hypothetical protein
LCSAHATAIELYDLTGRLLSQQPVDAHKNQTELPVQGYPEGVYIVVLRGGEEVLYQQKLVIK